MLVVIKVMCLLTLPLSSITLILNLPLNLLSNLVPSLAMVVVSLAISGLTVLIGMSNGLLAQQQLTGYAYLDGVVIHTVCTDALSPDRIVVLSSARRLVALKLAHNSDFGGHCGVKRSLKRLYNCVTWPNISRDVSKYIKYCPECQKQAKDPRHKAPLYPLPIVGCPFKRIAFDIVGPYPRTKKQVPPYQHLLF